MSKDLAKRGAPGGEVPAAELWTAPMAWMGTPLKPVENWSREFPATAVFVRGELIFTLNETLGSGMTRQTERAVPGLIRLEGGKAVEVHAPGFDGRCWTYRLEKEGRKSRWKLYAGAAFPATEPAEMPTIEYVVVQSILPMSGGRKHVSFRIREDGTAENFASAHDPDSKD